MINLIDENANFNQQITQFPNNLATIAVFGSQSSGKSTLMNDAFKTQFPVLDTRQTRTRCTKGIWFQKTQKFNVIDTEGFDSAERANEERIFERQVALFCLAISDVIIVNLWMNQIGRYEGSQVHILKAIINASRRLIKSQQKTIFFVVKDCSVDANKNILKEGLDNTIGSILRGSTEKESIKFNIEYVFLSHYLYRNQQYRKQVAQLPNLIKVRKSVLKDYSAKDRVIYMHHLWNTIKTNTKEIDLRVEEEALKMFIVERIRKEVIENITYEVKQTTTLPRHKSYERYAEHYIKKSFQEIRKELPLSTSQELIKIQYFLLEEELDYQIQTHFSDIVLPNEQNRIIDKVLLIPLRRSYESVQLEKMIREQRKLAIQEYRTLINRHKQASILTRLFSQRVNQESLKFERQVSHLFNMFETKLQKEINREIDRQVRNIDFNGEKLNQSIKRLCKTFQYNEWEVNLKEIWQKASQRVLNQKIPQKIENLSERLDFAIWQEDKEAEIIAFHKQLQKKLNEFCSAMLAFFEQEQSLERYSQKIKDKIHESLEKCIIREKKRFHLSLIMIAIFLFFVNGELLFLLKVFKFKKKSRRYIGYMLTALMIILVVCGVMKNKVKNNNNNRER